MEPIAAGMLIAALTAPLAGVLAGWLMRGPAVARETDRANRLEAERDEAREAVRALVARERAGAAGITRDAAAHQAIAEALLGGGDDDAAAERVLLAMRARERARVAAAAAGPAPAAAADGGGDHEREPGTGLG
jgi:hypothetical protein